MLAENNLRELLEFSATTPVLSVYLNTEPSEGNADAYRLRLRSMLKDAALPQDVAAVEKFIATSYDWSGRSVAIFSCAEKDFFRAYPLEVPTRSLVSSGPTFAVKPLADLLDNFGGYGVVLVDKQGARLFYYHMGKLREQEGVLGDPVKKVKAGGTTVAGGRGTAQNAAHHLEEIVERNMRETVDFAVKFFEDNHVRRVLVGGTEDNVALFRSLLPKAWQSLVSGSFHMNMNASHSDVLAKALQIGHETERKREARLVENLITTAAKGAGAVLGLRDALRAAEEGRVQTLLVAEGYQQAGFRCSGCGSLLLESGERCKDDCSEPRLSVADLVDPVVHKVLAMGGNVEIVHTHEALQGGGHIGAMLRY